MKRGNRELAPGPLWILLGAVLALRLLSMALFPFLDTTEARYAEISRLVLISGEWLMPQFQPDVPFWGKPPLFAWLTAGSFSLFGVSEFTARLPHFLLGLVTLWLTWLVARSESSHERSLLGILILASTPLFFASSGTVMTESGLMLSTTLCMAGFWLHASGGARHWGLVFFAGLGLGLMAKGPVTTLMSVLPVLAWSLGGKRWCSLRTLPWLAGIPLAILIAAPWYIAAERQSPGFLEYFLIGEHLMRFIRPDWAGDLYGNAHSEPIGFIWILWFQATAAWGVLMVFVAGKFVIARFREASWRWPLLSAWQSYLAWWTFTPLVFFTFSGNILWTYVLSGMPAFALLLASRSPTTGNTS